MIQTFNLNIYRIDLHPTCRDGKAVVVDVRSEVIFWSLKEWCCGNQFCGRIWPSVHTFDLSSCAIHEISVYGEKCNHMPINGCVLLIGLWMQLLHGAGKQVTWLANQLTDQLTIHNRQWGG